uniref:Uncharacterized protein n=1 Tax=Ascaris lumbricoides TaxID=6252 RepID=A0A0M3HWI1_ASCLU
MKRRCNNNLKLLERSSVFSKGSLVVKMMKFAIFIQFLCTEYAGRMICK